jgi:SnoaL-like domain
MGLQLYKEISHGRGSPSDFKSACEEDVVFHSPIVVNPVAGIDRLMTALTSAFASIDNIEYTDTFCNEERGVLLWHWTIKGHAAQSVTVFKASPSGKIAEIAALVRPWPVVSLFRAAMQARFPNAPAHYWELPAS